MDGVGSELNLRKVKETRNVPDLIEPVTEHLWTDLPLALPPVSSEQFLCKYLCVKRGLEAIFQPIYVLAKRTLNFRKTNPQVELTCSVDKQSLVRQAYKK